MVGVLCLCPTVSGMTVYVPVHIWYIRLCCCMGFCMNPGGKQRLPIDREEKDGKLLREISSKTHLIVLFWTDCDYGSQVQGGCFMPEGSHWARCTSPTCEKNERRGKKMCTGLCIAGYISHIFSSV